MSTELQPAATPTSARLGLAGDGAAFEAAFHCELCGEVIGVYEPLVVCERSYARTTSLAAEPGLRARDGAYSHRACFSQCDSLAG